MRIAVYLCLLAALCASPAYAQQAPAAAQDAAQPATIHVTFHVEAMGGGITPGAQVTISAKHKRGTPPPAFKQVVGVTNKAGEFAADLPAGDYNVLVEFGEVSDSEDVHIDAKSKVIRLDLPQPNPV